MRLRQAFTITVVAANLLVACGSDEDGNTGGTGDGVVSTATLSPQSVPPPVADVRDEVVQVCNRFVADIQGFNGVSDGLIKPGTNAEDAVLLLRASQQDFTADAFAFREIGETEAAAIVGGLVKAIGHLAAAIHSSGSVRAGLRSQLANMQAAIVAVGEIGRTCPS